MSPSRLEARLLFHCRKGEGSKENIEWFDRERERDTSAGGQKHSGYFLNVGEKNYIEGSDG